MGWQCDIQIAYGSLWKAFGGFRLSQEGEAATRLLAHISDLQQTAKTRHHEVIVTQYGKNKPAKLNKRFYSLLQEYTLFYFFYLNLLVFYLYIFIP